MTFDFKPAIRMKRTAVQDVLKENRIVQIGEHLLVRLCAVRSCGIVGRKGVMRAKEVMVRGRPPEFTWNRVASPAVFLTIRAKSEKCDDPAQ